MVVPGSSVILGGGGTSFISLAPPPFPSGMTKPSVNSARLSIFWLEFFFLLLYSILMGTHEVSHDCHMTSHDSPAVEDQSKTDSRHYCHHCSSGRHCCYHGNRQVFLLIRISGSSHWGTGCGEDDISKFLFNVRLAGLWGVLHNSIP